MKRKFIGRLLSIALSATLAATTFSTPAFAAEMDLEQADDIALEEVIEDEDLQDAAEFTEETMETEESVEFSEEEIATEEFEEIAEEDAQADIEANFEEEDIEAGFEDISGNDSEDISGNDSGEESENESYKVTYEFIVDGEPASAEVLAKIHNPNGKTEFSPEEDATYAYVELLDPEAPANMEFLGWYLGGTKLSYSYYYTDDDIEVREWYRTIYADTTFTAKFATVNKVTLAETDNKSQIIEVRKGKTINPNNVEEPVNPGYFFVGWYTEKDGGKKVDFKTQAITEDVTYYAHWEEINYTVKFHSDEKSKDVVTRNYKVSEIKEDETFGFADVYTDETKYADIIKKQDEFKGWISSNEFYPGSCRVFSLMESEAATSAAMTIDLYAQWSEDSYTVVFDAKGTETINLSNEYFGEGDFSVNSPDDLIQNKTFFVGEGVILTGREFVRDGYKLTGWKNSATGKTIAAAGSFEDLAKKGETVTLTAVWNAENYTIEYNFNGGKAVNNAKYPAKVTYNKANTPDSKLVYNIEEYEDEDGYIDYYTSDTPVITKDGYRFVRWEDENGHMVRFYGGEGNYRNMKLTAYWSPIDYYMDFDLDGGQSNFGWSGGSLYFTYGYKYTMASRVGSVYRNGYTFTGWKYDSNDNGKIDENDKILSAKATIKNLTDESGKVILAKAQWKANSYSLTYVNGKAAKQQNAVKKYTADADVVINAPTRAGYTFEGYTVTSKDKKAYNAQLTPVDAADLTKGYTLSKGSYGNLVLTANWTDTARADEKYKIQILPGASGVTTADGTAVDETNGVFYMDGEEVAYTDISTMLEAPGFVKANSQFKGYSYTKNGKVIANATVGGHTAKDGVVTLYVVWTARTDSDILSSDARISNKGSNIYVSSLINALPASKKTYTYGKALKLPKLSMKGYKFLGWELVNGSENGLTKDKTGKYITKIGKEYSDDNLTLSPVFDATKIKVYFNPQGGDYQTTGSKKVVIKEAYYGEDIMSILEEKGLFDVSKKNARLSRLALDSKGKNTLAYSGGGYYSSYYAMKDITIFAIWYNCEAATPEKFSASLGSDGILTVINKDTYAANYEIQYATDKKFTKSVHTKDVGYCYKDESNTFWVTGNRYYVRMRTYTYDSTGAKVYSNWSKQAVATRSAENAD